MKPSPAEILEAIQALSPGQRRRLYRRLRTIGLLETGGPWADTRRLHTAPAVRRSATGDVLRPQPIRPAPPKPKPAPTPAPPPETPKPPAAKPQPPAPHHAEQYHAEEYHSSVRSKVILGAPTPNAAQPLEVMAPVPGQAPEGPIRIIFDGGSRGNPGKGYGSYALDWPGLPQQIVQLRFGDRVTNNEAEYDTLISALEATIKKLEDGGAGPKTAQLEIFGDSQLVVKQVLGEWAVKNPRMQTRCERARYLLGQFGRWRLQHHDREHSVRTLGH